MRPPSTIFKRSRKLENVDDDWKRAVVTLSFRKCKKERPVEGTMADQLNLSPEESHGENLC